MTVHVEESIDRYFEGRIELLEDRDALFGHLDRCAPCRTHFDHLAVVHRALARPGESLPPTELALIKRSVLTTGASKKEPRLFPGRLLAAISAPLFAAGLAFFLLPGTDAGLVAKGGPIDRTTAVEALCFNAEKEITAHLREDGACVSPGFLKVIYASPRTVPSLIVAAIEDEEIRFAVELKSPKPRSVVPEFAELKAGSTVRIVALAGDRIPDREELLAMKPRIVVEGVSR